jgi:hypothetical protein
MVTKGKKYLNRRLDGDVKGLLKALLHANKNKNNTEMCITHFVNKIPEFIKKNWNRDLLNINSICTARNKITHAEDYFIRDNDMYLYMKFTEILLIITLFNKIGIDFPTIGAIVTRIEGSHLIEKIISN